MLVLNVPTGEIVWLGNRESIEELTRRRANGETVDLPDSSVEGRLAAILVLEARNGKVELGFAAPSNLRILRDKAAGGGA